MPRVAFSPIGLARFASTTTTRVLFDNSSGGLASIDTLRELVNEQASPGYYACELKDAGIKAELSVTSRGAVHQYTFTQDCTAVIAIDLSHGGIAIEDGQTVPSGHTSSLMALMSHTAKLFLRASRCACP